MLIFFFCISVYFKQDLHADHGQFSLDKELHMDNVNKQWDKFTLSQQERDMAIQAEIQRYKMLFLYFVECRIDKKTWNHQF